MKGYRLPVQLLPGTRLAAAKSWRRFEPLHRARLRLRFKWSWQSGNARSRWSMTPLPPDIGPHRLP